MVAEQRRRPRGQHDPHQRRPGSARSAWSGSRTRASPRDRRRTSRATPAGRSRTSRPAAPGTAGARTSAAPRSCRRRRAAAVASTPGADSANCRSSSEVVVEREVQEHRVDDDRPHVAGDRAASGTARRRRAAASRATRRPGCTAAAAAKPMNAPLTLQSDGAAEQQDRLHRREADVEARLRAEPPQAVGRADEHRVDGVEERDQRGDAEVRRAAAAPSTNAASMRRAEPASPARAPAPSAACMRRPARWTAPARASSSAVSFETPWIVPCTTVLLTIETTLLTTAKSPKSAGADQAAAAGTAARTRSA